MRALFTEYGYNTHARIPVYAGRTQGFRFRAMLCRRFLGDPLADALQLPAPPADSSYWTFSAVRTGTALQLMIFRVYCRLGRLGCVYLYNRFNMRACKMVRKSMDKSCVVDFLLNEGLI